MAQLMLMSAIVATYMCYVQGQSSCSTPSGAGGTCISLYDCGPLLSIINNPKKSQADINLLRSSSCGFDGSVPKVCCPSGGGSSSCITGDGQQGECVNVNSCAHIAAMLKPPVSQSTVSFIQKSKCNGPDKFSVCCGSSPGPNPGPKPGPTPGKGKVCSSTALLPAWDSGCCGRDASAGDRIVGGEPTAIDQYPWMAYIEYVKDNKIRLLCGGSLISGKYVLTAGHCVVGQVLNSGTPRNVRLAEYNSANDVAEKDCAEANGGGFDCNDGVTVIAIEKVIPHPEYKPYHRLRRHDIALLRLRQMAPYTDFIRPICLPQSDTTLSPPAKFALYVAGWGAVNETHSKSDIKLHVKVPYKPLEECQLVYNKPTRNLPLWEGQMCAGGEKDRDSCKGDSGGPLMYENDKTFELIGVVSFGPTPCGMEKVPGVYTKVYQYVSWIRDQIQP